MSTAPAGTGNKGFRTMSILSRKPAPASSHTQAIERREELKARLVELQDELATIVEDIQANPASSLTRAAQALLTGTKSVSTRRGELMNEIAVTTKAIELIQVEVTDALTAEQREKRIALVPEHKKLAGEIGVALKTLQRAIHAEARFRRKLEIENIGFGTPMECGTNNLLLTFCGDGIERAIGLDPKTLAPIFATDPAPADTAIAELAAYAYRK
jgi:hypothetical protein